MSHLHHCFVHDHYWDCGAYCGPAFGRRHFGHEAVCPELWFIYWFQHNSQLADFPQRTGGIVK